MPRTTIPVSDPYGVGAPGLVPVGPTGIIGAVLSREV